MPESLEIQSHKGSYRVAYHDLPRQAVAAALTPNCVVVIDRLVADFYRDALRAELDGLRLIEVEATEQAKTIDEMVPLIEHLVALGLKRNQTLVAIGGGVIQDIVCFISSVYMRGIQWHFVPTTLLAQADSCIGSKSSVNTKSGKNLLGTFYPPRRIEVSAQFLDTLAPEEVQSGIGEIIKVHAIDGVASFDYLASKFDALGADKVVLAEFIARALGIKKRYIEIDEFDEGPRNIFNYGHSFGHAIESATNFGVPHGIAVTMGMKIAGDFAVEYGELPAMHRDRMLPLLRKNYVGYASLPIDAEAVFKAMAKDKKNTVEGYRIIIPKGDDARIEAQTVKPDDRFLATLKAGLAL